MDTKKTSKTINIQEPLIETRVLKKNRGMHIDSDKFRLCWKCVEVMHLASKCSMLAGNEYLKRHNNVLKFLMTTLAVKKEQLEKCQC